MGGGEPWAEIAELQDGVIARRQLLNCGLTARQSRRHLDSGRWRQACPGVYFTFTGPASDEARLWAAVLYAGPGSAAGGRTALWLAGSVAVFPDPIEICVPRPRQVRPVPGVRIRRVRRLDQHLHPAALPPRVRLEVAILDVAERCEREEQVVDVVLRSIQRRLTTADRIAEQLRRRPRQRWRALLADVLQAATDGVASALELRYVRDVEQAHGLPTGRRNRPTGTSGRRRYHDVRYEEFATVVELDGREAHPLDEAFRDLRRDNEAVLDGDRTLHYGWRDVVGSACDVAGQVGRVLTDQGWTGTLRRCGPTCTAVRSG